MQPDTLDARRFDDLAGAAGGDLISIVIPTHERGPRQLAQDPIRFKNELTSVESTLEERGWRPPAIHKRLDRATRLFDDREFLEHQSAGLAVYIDEEGDTTAIALSRSPRARSFVLGVFAVRPLVGELRPTTYDVLAATRGAVRFYRSHGRGVAVVDADLPRSFEDVNWFVDRERQRQRHPDRAGSDRNIHGHRSSGVSDEDTARFVRAIARSLPDSQHADPLIVLGDDRLVADLRGAIDRPTTSPPNSGLTDPDSASEVGRVARDAISVLDEERAGRVHEEMTQQLATGHATTSIGDALPAAHSGRLSSVAVHLDAEPVWGRFDETGFAVDISTERRPGDVDLLDRVVVEGRRTGADIHALSAEVDGSPVVAVFRY